MDTDQKGSIKILDYRLLEIVYLFILPVVLIYLGVIPIEGRAIVLFVVSLLIVSIMKYNRWTKEMMGLSNLFRTRAIAVYGIATILGVFCIRGYAQLHSFTPLNLFDLKQSAQLLLFFIPLSVLQEVAYRSFLAYRLKSFSSSRILRVLVSASLFALLHIMYPFPALVLPLAFVGGIVFALLYEKYPDLLLICIMHAILNFTAVFFGFFTP